MDRNTLWRLGKALPLVLSCFGLADCGGNNTTTTELPPTAIAAKRYTAGGQLDAGFSGGAVATKIHRLKALLARRFSEGGRA